MVLKVSFDNNSMESWYCLQNKLSFMDMNEMKTDGNKDKKGIDKGIYDGMKTVYTLVPERWISVSHAGISILFSV